MDIDSGIVRLIQPQIEAALLDTPVILINGARQTGKTTLVRQLRAGGYPATYFTLDDFGILSSITKDPQGFIAGLNGPVIIDEVQRAPEIFVAIKRVVDERRLPGRFLLTGSANVLLLPTLSDSLAGRMEVFTLWPLSQREIEGAKGSFCDALFGDNLQFPTDLLMDREEMIHRVSKGGFPEPHTRASEPRRRAWFKAYITTILQRDLRDISNIAGIREMPNLLGILAARSANLLNTADISRASQLPYATLSRYMAILQTAYLIQMIPSWSNNLGKRLVKSPKLMINDTGLLLDLMGMNEKRLLEYPTIFGPVLENFVALELIKDAGFSQAQPRIYHYRSHAGQEVDLVLEHPSGAVVGIEVKAAASVESKTFDHMRELASAAGKKFVRGLVLYGGSQVIPFAENMHAVPISAIWKTP